MKRAIGLIACALLLSACASSGEKPAAGSAKATLTNTPTQAPKPQYKILSKSDLKAAILPVNKLPTGYGKDPDADGKETDKTYCDYKQPFKASAYAEGDFLKGGGLNGEYALITLRQFDSIAHAAASFKTLVDTMDSCTNDSIEGEKVKFSVLSMPDLEDGSIGVSTSTSDYTIPQFFALTGPTLISVGGGGLMSADSDMLLGLLKSQIDSYKQAAMN